MSVRLTVTKEHPDELGRRLTAVLRVGSGAGQRGKRERGERDQDACPQFRSTLPTKRKTRLKHDSVPDTWEIELDERPQTIATMHTCDYNQLESIENSSKMCHNSRDIPESYIRDMVSREGAGLYWLVKGVRQNEDFSHVFGYAVCHEKRIYNESGIFLSLLCNRSEYAPGRGLELFRNVFRWVLDPANGYAYFALKPVSDGIGLKYLTNMRTVIQERLSHVNADSETIASAITAIKWYSHEKMKQDYYHFVVDLSVARGRTGRR